MTGGRLGAVAYSYRHDPAVPPFPDDRPLVLFDGVCVLCSASARLLLRLDRGGRFRLAVAQAHLGRALYRHYGLDPDTQETYLLVADGRAWGKSDAVLEMARRLGWPWRGLGLLRLVPRSLRDAAYDLVARNRYRLFGRRDACMLPSSDMRERFVE